jgi:hypothetical protein
VINCWGHVSADGWSSQELDEEESVRNQMLVSLRGGEGELGNLKP